MGETEQLYTARGEQGMGTSVATLEAFGVTIDEEKYDSLLRWHYTSKNPSLLGKRQSFQVKRPLFTVKQTPAFVDEYNFMFVSIPQYSFLSKRNIDDLRFKNLLVWVKDPENNRDLIDTIAAELSLAVD